MRYSIKVDIGGISGVIVADNRETTPTINVSLQSSEGASAADRR